MAESFPLKSIAKEAIPKAIERAAQYRVLNEPEQAESICLDVLETDPENQEALVVLLLALTDQFPVGKASVRSARALLPKLSDGYQHAYYSGIICEREARALLGRGNARVFAYDWFRDAMDWYEKAEAIRPAGDAAALFRWNACVRSIQKEKLKPPPNEREEQPLE